MRPIFLNLSQESRTGARALSPLQPAWTAGPASGAVLFIRSAALLRAGELVQKH